MNVVNFSEGILGIDPDYSPIVAKCLRQIASEQSDVSPVMMDVAEKLDLGDRIDIGLIRQITEPWLANTQKLFLSL